MRQDLEEISFWRLTKCEKQPCLEKKKWKTHKHTHTQKMNATRINNILLLLYYRRSMLHAYAHWASRAHCYLNRKKLYIMFSGRLCAPLTIWTRFLLWCKYMLWICISLETIYSEVAFSSISSSSCSSFSSLSFPVSLLFVLCCFVAIFLSHLSSPFFFCLQHQFVIVSVILPIWYFCQLPSFCMWTAFCIFMSTFLILIKTSLQ